VLLCPRGPPSDIPDHFLYLLSLERRLSCTLLGVTLTSPPLSTGDETLRRRL
jgi:hypothetical protein